MPLRGRPLSSRMPSRALGATVLAVLLSLSAGTVQALPTKPDPGNDRPGVEANPDPVRGTNAKAKPRPVDAAAKAAVKRLDKAELPDKGRAEVPVTASEAANKAKAPKPVRVGGLPVTVTATPPKSDKQDKASLNAKSAPKPSPEQQTPSAESPGTVRVEVLDTEHARKTGSAALLKVTSTKGGPGGVKVTLDYSAFDEAYGGAYGSRLHLVELPACAATSRLGSKSCSGRPKELGSVNDSDTKQVSAQLTLTDADVAPTAVPSARVQAAQTSGSTVIALMAGDSSSKGNYKATPLSPSASWSVAKFSGGFSWNYPMRAVPTPGGLTPSVGLGYSSQSIDGRTSATNSQGSWIGEGFSYEPGYVERSYKPCADDGHESSAEQCWAVENATIMLNGSTTQLLKDDVTGKWHLADESGAKIEQLTGASNGDNNGEHWKVTTPDGTEYYFGLGRLPGWSSGKEQTASTWTVPVFGDDLGEPCYNSTFTSAHCKQAWRWNLDYVKDTHGNVMSYFYGAETNHYALNGKTDVNGTAYHRGGYLKRIDYGQRDGAVYSAAAPARVVFNTAERCLPTADFDCAPAKFTTDNAAHWPDTPVDRYCKADTKCDVSQSSPTFFTRKRLTGITTQMRTGEGTYQDVDAWTFTHTFTDNGDDTKTLWLHKIDHEGKVGGSSKLPSLELQGIQLKNRVDSNDDNIDAFHRFRLTTVLSETGSQLDVTYAPTECTATALPKPGESTKRCYPVIWAPPGSIDPRADWFHKYVVEEIRETDRTGGGDDLVTRYDYQGAAGWRHAESDGVTDEKYLTWGQWQGYGKVTVTSGNGETTSTRADYTFLQGLNGDKKPGGGTRTETVTDSTGKTYTGHKEFTGFTVEAKTYDKATGGKVVSKVVSEPWKHDTATQTKSWATTKATVVKPRTSRGYKLLSDGSWRQTKSVSYYDTSVPTVRLIRTESFGDVSKDDDDTCTRLWYADNPTKNIYTLPSRSQIVSVDCSASPDYRTQILADKRTSYDGGAFGAAPTKGEVTRTERLTQHDGTTATYQVTGTTSYDEFGRPTAQTDAGGAKTTTSYTETSGLLSQTKVTNALGHVTTTDYAPAWGRSTGQSDPNGKRTDLAYDPLGRLVKVWLPDREMRTNPSIKYSYLVSRDKPTAVKTERLENDGSYEAAYQLYDGLMRPRQTQAEGLDGTRLVADVFYDGTGKPKKTNATYNAVGAPSRDLLLVANGEVGAQTVSQYDGLGRTTATIFQVAGVEQWRTSVAYNGERTYVDPPNGGTATTTITDAQGRTTELRHHTSPGTGPSAGYDATKYAYDHAGRLAAVTDAKGNTWRYEYDQLGRKTKSIDPDAGTSTTAYDGLDRPVSTTDARGNKISTVYDKLSRPLTTWEGEPNTGTKLTETRYDRAGWLGLAYASLRYTSATEYIATVTQSMDALYRPLKTAYSVPESEGALAGIYVFTNTYNLDGTAGGMGMPGAGGLTDEAIAFGYDALQRPTSMTGKDTYVAGAGYTQLSQLKNLHLPTASGKYVEQTFSYEKGTNRLTESKVNIEGTGLAKQSQYSYDQAGNIQSISDLAGASPDVQCFAYDTRQRLTEAWTPESSQAQATGSGTVGGQQGGQLPAACGSTAGSSALGGPAPYWTSYQIDAIGNRTSEVRHDTGLDTAKDVTRTYTYGVGDAGPHAVTKVTENTPTGASQSTYTYDATGNTTTRTIGGDTQTLTWNAVGKPTKTTEADGKETTYLYDAGGNRVVRRDAQGTTVFLPGMELSLAKGSSTVKATRYYSFAGQTIAVREDDGTLSYLASDHQGTSSLAINATTGEVAQRRFNPYGAERGEATGTWPGEKGFVGGTPDTQSGLTHIGAREYDPDLGKFISVDPLIDYTDPQQMNGYGYANNSPVTLSDPSGLRPDGACGGASSRCNGNIETWTKTSSGWNWSQTPVPPSLNDESVAAYLITVALDAQGAEHVRNKDTVSHDEFRRALIKYQGVMDGPINDAQWEMWLFGFDEDVIDNFGPCLIFDCNKPVSSDDLREIPLNRESFLEMFGRAYAEGRGARAGLSGASRMAKGLSRVLGGCTKCFLAGTDVLMADGTTKDIEDVELGDEVLATDPETGETGPREVTRLIVTEHDKHFNELSIVTEDGTENLTATYEHPFWSPSESRWVEAGDLETGMTLLSDDGTTVIVSKNRPYTQHARTYNLTVDDLHTYYVLAGETPVLVHNSNRLCGPVAGNGASLGNLTGSEVARIQNAADRIGHPISVVGSRATGNTHAQSDWDYVITGINSRTKHSVKSSLPQGPVELGRGGRIDIFTWELAKGAPHITFYPRGAQ